MYGIVLMAAMTGGVESSAACPGRACGGRAASGCAQARPARATGCAARAPRARATRCSGYSCHGTYHGGCGGVSYAAPTYSHSYAAPMTYSAPMTHSAPMTYSAPVSSGCAMGHPIGGTVTGGTVSGGVIIGGEAATTTSSVIEGTTTTETSAPARIDVTLPAEATLTIDGLATTSTSGNRTFESPALEQGKTYTYNLKAEYTTEGKPVVVAKTVQVHAGAKVSVSMFGSPMIASK